MRASLAMAFSAILGLVAACTPTPDDDAPVYIEDLSCSSGPFKVELPNTVDALRKFAPLRDERLVETLVWGDNSKSDVRELHFDGLDLVIVTDAAGPGYALEAATVTDAKWAIAPNFRVGDPYEDVVGRLLPGSKVSPAARNFAGGGDSVEFVVKDRQIVEIKIACYAG